MPPVDVAPQQMHDVQAGCSSPAPKMAARHRNWKIHLRLPLIVLGDYSSLFPGCLRFVIPSLFSVIPTEAEGSRAARRDLSVFSTLRSFH